MAKTIGVDITKRSTFKVLKLQYNWDNIYLKHYVERNY